jgi:outer membrane immunogenic protein
MKTVARLTICLIASFAMTALAGPEQISPKESKEVVMPAPEPCTWAGFYVGGHIGYGFNGGDTDITFLPDTPENRAEAVGTSLDPEADGVVGGAQVGYNYQRGHFVIGAETDFSASGMDGSKTRTPIVNDVGQPFHGNPEGTHYFTHQDTDWYGTFRLRLGYAPNCSWLIYATGGLAYGHVNFSADSDFRPTIHYPASVDETEVGWTAGGGVEFALNRRWSLKVEYLYIDLGDETATGVGVPLNPPFSSRYRWDTQAHTANVGLNYRF